MAQAKKKESGAHRELAIRPVRELSPLDVGAAEEKLEDFLSAADEAGIAGLRDALKPETSSSRFVSAVFDLSDFLRDATIRRPDIVAGLLRWSVDERLAQIDAEIATLAGLPEQTELGLMASLREFKLEAHVLIGLDDLSGSVDTATTVARLSALAGACVSAAVNFLLLQTGEQGKLKLVDQADPAKGSGWIVLGMGKLGAHELNYSSDIDLIVFVDTDAASIADPFEATELFTRLTRRLVRILQDRTEHGYVFRTDLRLRPDPGATPLAIPVEAALNYYEGRGQNWERAAMIKARPIAGDKAAGEAFLKELQPYVWRKYMDYAAIADVHSIKRQIHAHKGHSDIAVKGHNVKLGRGGIREIEFFVQTQQLIAGGRFPELRGRRTVEMLEQLAARGWISKDAAGALAVQYWFLRRVEHAVQIIADEQTHELPETDEGLERVSRLLGYRSSQEFSDEFRRSLETVESHYSALFETAPQLSTTGNLVFTGEVDDPGTIETLTQMGFERPSDICRIIRTWHFGRYRATRSAEARERLTELTPALLDAFARTRRADDAIIRFDAFLSGLPAGIQLFSLLQSNAALLNLLVTIMGAAPRLAAIVTRRPHVFDGLLDPGLLTELPTKAYLAARLSSFVQASATYEERLDRLRIFAAEQKFLIGMRLLTGTISAERAGFGFSDLADLAIGATLEAVEAEFARQHGRIAGGRVVVLGLGKLGSRELTAGSDVDLILLYDHKPDAEGSKGTKPLPTSQYYIRLTQRLIAAVSAPTAEGVLYELDLRLRPSGNKGPVATHIESFRKYQASDAWTWEHMALTRARVIAGDEAFAAEVMADVGAILAKPRAFAHAARDAVEMRDLIAEEKPARDLWDVKLSAGGLLDLEFIAQVARLTGRCASGCGTDTASVLGGLAADFADADARSNLLEAFGLYSRLTQIIRLCLDGPFDRKDVPQGLVDLLLTATDTPDLKVLEAQLNEMEQAVRTIFDRLLRARLD